MQEPEPIPVVAARHDLDVRRLRGKIHRERLTGDLSLPIGSLEHDLVYDDWRVAELAKDPTMRADISAANCA